MRFKQRVVDQQMQPQNRITLIFQNIVRAHPRHLRFTLVAVIFLCILCFGIISVNRTSNGTAIMRDRSVEAANIKAREMFGNVPFPDPVSFSFLMQNIPPWASFLSIASGEQHLTSDRSRTVFGSGEVHSC
ncbi:hypothetical protein Y032_0004g1709 [Ancylostoma ceylanicum]|uniref:Uncharacterized protein n=1 Tax=Ancylostoma ceylanicum TaxID=53326 RepID=A0A016VSW9_9BILA|nr:hypothetical protein Y032_0004g1709 [Ancylostoma ceylanicum]